MRNISSHIICRSFLLMLVVMLSACVNTLELAVPNGEQGISHQSAVANAKVYFDTHFGQNTRSNNQTPTEEAPYVVGDLVPDWESGVTVSDNERAYSDFAISKSSRFFLALQDDREELCALELHSRLASVVDFGLDTLNQYIATYIPDIAFLSCYTSYAKDDLLTCEYIDWFTGVVLYSDLSGYHIAAYKYYDGQLVDSSFLYDKQKSQEENIADFMRVMGGVSLIIAPENNDTRAVATVDIPGGTYICCYDELTGKILWEYYNIDTIPIVNTTQTNYNSFIASGGSSNIGFGSVDATVRPLIPTGGGGGGTTTTEKEKLTPEKFADKIIKNTLSPADSAQIHTMLTEILNDCMGQTLLQELYDKDEKINIKFDSTVNNSNYTYKDAMSSTGEITKTFNFTITLNSTFSEVLLHEFFHFYQHLSIGSKGFKSAKVNYEVEAYFLTLMYLNHTTNQGVHSRYEPFCQTDIGSLLDFCSEYINPDGSFEGANKEEIEISKIFCGYYFSDASWWYKNKNPECLYDENQTIATNIKNFQILMKNCD